MHVLACLESEAAAVIPDNKVRSVVADGLSIFNVVNFSSLAHSRTQPVSLLKNIGQVLENMID